MYNLVSSMPGRDDDKTGSRIDHLREATRVIDTYVGLVVGSRGDIDDESIDRLARSPPAGKIFTYRHSVPLARPVSPCKRCPPVPTSRMLVDFTGTLSRDAREIETRARDTRRHERLKYVRSTTPRDVRPLASSLTKMAAPANNRKQFPVSRATALQIDSARHALAPCITTPVTSSLPPPPPSPPSRMDERGRTRMIQFVNGLFSLVDAHANLSLVPHTCMANINSHVCIS